MDEKYIPAWLVADRNKEHGTEYTVHMTRTEAEKKFTQMAKDYGELLGDMEILMNDEDDMKELAAGGVYNAPDGNTVEIISTSVSESELRSTTKSRELEYLRKFAAESDFSGDVQRDLFLCLWTAYCLHYDLIVDTRQYDDDLMSIWFSMGESEEERAIGWGGLARFTSFTAKLLA